MSYQYNNTSIADTKKLSLATWFRIPASGSPSFDGRQQYLFEFGVVPEGALTDNCHLRISRNDTSTIITARLTGVARDIAGGDFGQDIPHIDIAATNQELGAGNGFTTPFFTSVTWNLLCFSVDLSTSDVASVGAGPGYTVGTLATMVFNKVNLLTKSLDTQFNGYFPDGLGLRSSGSGSNWIYNQNPLYGGAPDPAYTIPTFNMSVSGTQIGIPCNAEDIGSRAPYVLGRAYTHVWFGQYIDWTNATNLSKVVTTDGRPPTNPQTASTYFGAPDLHFYRDKKTKVNFITNHGSGGAFTLVGGQPDFTPGPSL